MRLFTGTFYHTLDAKGRLTIPNKLRILTPEGGTLTEGAEACLHFFPPDAWQAQVQRILQLDELTERARDAQRKFFALAEECNFDRQGRITIPVALRQGAGISKDVAVIGVGTKIEIWQLEEWQRRKASIDAEAPEIFERAGRQSSSPT
ncbi:MAG: division/cell wall cluster transcriptional repressor MraZ [Chloroflexi bacterium]|nr:division/cell wall cluster transcriptional repressor MraZ [Chloroflexota bacterium]